jgi:hypothetical protein
LAIRSQQIGPLRLTATDTQASVADERKVGFFLLPSSDQGRRR